jgi:hypothetical protein
MNKQQKGFAPLGLILGVIVLLGVFVVIAMSRNPIDDSRVVIPTPASENNQTNIMFAELDEPEGTPEEINNEAVDELDAMIEEIETNAADVDLDDLTL